MSILLLYSSRYGHTYKIVLAMDAVLKAANKKTQLQAIHTYMQCNPKNYSHIIIGASVRYGDFDSRLYKWINTNIVYLKHAKVAFFGVNLVARQAAKSQVDTNPYIKKFFKKTALQPILTAVFAGALCYPRYHWLDRIMIRLIMYITKGPTETKQLEYDFTNWRAVELFAQQFLTVIDAPIEN